MSSLSRIAALVFFLLAVCLLCVSMPHLSAGVARITRCSFITSWFMAICFDLSQIAAEFGLILAPIVRLEKPIQKPCWAVLVSCTLVSIALNVDAFLMHADSVKGYVFSTAWGVLLPLGVLALSYIGSAFVIDRKELGLNA